LVLSIWKARSYSFLEKRAICLLFSDLGHAAFAPCSSLVATEGPLPSSNVRTERDALAPLGLATLKALQSLNKEKFHAHLKDFFPLLTSLITCEYAPAEMQQTLSELFSERISEAL
jgi:hypothetical protein